LLLGRLLAWLLLVLSRLATEIVEVELLLLDLGLEFVVLLQLSVPLALGPGCTFEGWRLLLVFLLLLLLRSTRITEKDILLLLLFRLVDRFF